MRKDTFYLYSGLGNTFVITDYSKTYDNPSFAKKICNNIYDGFMLVKKNPFEMILYNQDGSTASMCGNGIRCFTNYIYDRGYTKEVINDILTKSGIIKTKIISTKPFVTNVEMVKPNFVYVDKKEHINEQIIVNNHIYNISLVDTGVWHGVIIPSDFNEALKDAKAIKELKEYKDYLNIDFLKLDTNIYQKTYERGVGFTKACGTGALASFIILEKLNKIEYNCAWIFFDEGMLKVGKINDVYYIEGTSEYIKNIIL